VIYINKMGKNDHARLPSVDKNMFDKGNWQAFIAVVKYIEDLTVWAATTQEKGDHGKKYNLLWLPQCSLATAKEKADAARWT